MGSVGFSGEFAGRPQAIGDNDTIIIGILAGAGQGGEGKVRGLRNRKRLPGVGCRSSLFARVLLGIKVPSPRGLPPSPPSAPVHSRLPLEP